MRALVICCAAAAIALGQPARLISPEDAMRARVKAFTLTDYRIAAVMRELIETGRMPFDRAKGYIVADDELVRDLAMKQAADGMRR